MGRFRTWTVALTALALMACETDSYESGTGEYSLMTGDLVEVRTGSEGMIETFTTDNDVAYTLTSPITASWAQEADTCYRALLYYNLVDEGSGIVHYTDGMAEAVSISQVPVVSIISLALQDSMKTDPADFESLWMAANGAYLNLAIYMKIGESESDLAYHTIGLVRDSIVKNPDDTRTLCLTLYHDQGDMPEYYSQKYYVSAKRADLIADPLIPSSVADSVRLTINTYNGIFQKTIGL